MEKIRRTLALLLVFCMLLGYFPGTVFAEDEQTTDAEYHEAASVEEEKEAPQEEQEEAPQEEQQDNALSEAVLALLARLEALPAVEDVASMSAEEKAELSEELDALCDAYYDGLSEAQQAQVTGFDKVGELYDALGAYGTNATNEYVESHIKFELNESDKTAIIRGYDSNDPPGKIQYNDDYANLAVGQYTVTAIGEGAMYRCNALYKVQIKEVVTVAEAALAECGYLEEVSLPKAKAIGSKAFDSCTALRNIELPLAKTIGANAFLDCKTLENIELPEAETIGEYAFNHCISLKEVSLPKAKTIESIVFDGCYSLGKIELPSATQINSDAFRGVKNCALTLPNNWNPNDAPVKQSDGTYSFRGGSFTSVSYTHDHIWSAEWFHNDTAHWHKCTAEGCPITDYSTCEEEGAAYGAHSYNAMYTCICREKKPVSYVYYENGEWQNGTRKDYEIISEDTTRFEDGKWYVYPGPSQKKGEPGVNPPSGTVTVSGTANLILIDGKGLDLSYNGLVVPESSTLNIYGQSEGSGSLTVHGANDAAGIGGSSGSSCGTVNIHGGVITAEGNYYGAGIGGGRYGNGGIITIYGGSVTAKGAYNSAGIGGGNGGNGGNVTIYGGTVKATGSLTVSSGGPGIGGSSGKDQGTLTLGTGVTFGAGVDAEHITEWSNLDNARTMNYFQTPYTAPAHTHVWSAEWSSDNAAHWHECTAEGCPITDYSTVPESGYAVHSYSSAGVCTECGVKKPVSYSYFQDGVRHNDGSCTEYEIVTGSTNVWEPNKWYVVSDNVTIAEPGHVYVIISANLILCDGARLEVTDIGGPYSGTLNIYGQEKDSGTLIAHGTGDEASIKGTNITINGGTVIATGNKGAGIGCADSNVTINGGNVTATSNQGAGIGGNYDTGSGTITINGGNITATSTWGAGIGGGSDHGRAGTITINGGNVTATSRDGAGIGGGYSSNGGNVTINGGNVTATSSDAGGIGHGRIGNGHKSLDNGTLTLGSGVTFGAGYSADQITRSSENRDHADEALGWEYFKTPYPPSHTHVWSADWSSDNAAHWHECTAEGCPITDYSTCGEEGAAYGEHDYGTEGAADACTVCGAGERAVLRTASLTLKGQIGVNFFMTIPEAMEGGYVQLTFRGAETKLPVCEAKQDDGRFKFTQLTAAKEMNDTINLKLLAPDGTPYALITSSGKQIPSTGFDYSVADYLKAAESIDSLKDFAEKMASYGAYAQILLNYNTEGVHGGDVSSVNKGTVAKYNCTQTGSMPSGLILKSMTLILESETSIRVYLNAASMDGCTITVDGKQVVPMVLGDAYYVQVDDIAAKDLDKMHKVTFSDGTDTATLTLCGLTYAAMTLDQHEGEKTYEDACNLSRALYLYCMAAKKVVR